MAKLAILVLLSAYFIGNSDADSMPWTDQITGMWCDVGETATIMLPQVATYRRIVRNAKGKEIEHLYRVCNGKNKAKCGYWENTNTKKKVASGTTTYNKNKQQLIIKKVRKTDAAMYMTGDKKKTFELFIYSN